MRVDFRALMMGCGFALMWSSAFTSAKVAVAYAPPFAILGVRFLISGLLAVGIAWVMGQRARLSRKQWAALAAFGVLQNVIYLGGNFYAAQVIDASLAVIIASLLPLLVAGANALRGERLGAMATVGLFAGLAGVLLIMGARLDGGADVTGVLIIVCAVLALTLATLLVQGASSGDNVIMVVGLQMLVGSAVLLPLSLATEPWVIDWKWQLIVAFTYTTLVPGLLATITWFMLVNRIGATRAATFHFLNPFLGVAIASFILGEALGLTDMLGVVVIMAGILAVQLSRRA